jgi:hypothetical protein
MPRSLVRRTMRATVVVGVVVAAVALIAGQAVAFHTVSHSGVRGQYSFLDTQSSPGARCDYEGAAGHGFFAAMKVRPPTVFWPNRHPGNPDEHGTVGWRVKIQHWNGMTWTASDVSSESTAVAREHSPAPFIGKLVHHEPPNSRRYRAQVVLTWYGANSSVLGRAKVILDWYNQTDPGRIVTSCKGVVCHVCMPVPGGARPSDVARNRLEAVPH